MRPSFSATIRHATWVLAGFCLIWVGGSSAQAGNLYVYTDSQGQAVMTDNLQQVPNEFRGRVRVMTDRESGLSGAASGGTGSAVNRVPASHNVMDKMLTAFAQKVSSHPIEGLTPHQTAVVIVAGVCWSVLLLWMLLSSNPAVRLLSKCLMVLVSVTAVYQMYFARTIVGEMVGNAPREAAAQAPENVIGQMKTKVEQSFRLQSERRAGQLDEAEPSNQ